MHIPEGLNWYEGVEDFWSNSTLERFIELLVPYEERLIVSLGSHTHYMAIKAPISSAHPNFKFT